MLFKKRTNKTRHRKKPFVKKKPFMEAKHGHFFRTRSLKTDSAATLGTQWLEACEDSQKKTWYIKKIEWRDVGDTSDDETSTVVEHIDDLQQGLSFFEAVRVLAKYEAGETSQKWEFADEKELDTLGVDHFVAFGHREFLAFDIYGQPHKTDQGHIIGKGSFAPEERALVKKIYEDSHQAVWHEGILSELFSRHAGTFDYDGIMDALGELARIDDFIGGVKEVVSYITDGIGEHFKWTFTRHDTSLGYAAIENAMQNMDDGKSKQELSRFVAYLRLAHVMIEATDSFRTMRTQSRHSLGRFSDFETLIDKAKKRYTALGASDEDIEKLHATVMGNSKLKVPQAVYGFIAELEKKRNHFSAAIDQQIKPQPPNIRLTRS